MSFRGKLAPPVSRDLVRVGPRHISTRVKHHPKRDENGDKPTTARALVLRNGKYGARGTGEMIFMGKLSGREKLDLLAGVIGAVHRDTYSADKIL